MLYGSRMEQEFPTHYTLAQSQKGRLSNTPPDQAHVFEILGSLNGFLLFGDVNLPKTERNL